VQRKRRAPDPFFVEMHICLPGSHARKRNTKAFRHVGQKHRPHARAIHFFMVSLIVCLIYATPRLGFKMPHGPRDFSVIVFVVGSFLVPRNVKRAATESSVGITNSGGVIIGCGRRRSKVLLQSQQLK
jgi:hypothetical protein